MANTTSAKKRIRQNISRTLINRARRTRIRTYLKKVDTAIAGGDKKEATEALRVAQPEIMRGVTKGIFKKNTVARKISRLSAKIKAL
ncbi:MAG: 30S ribosomal protein S20 [Rhodospirillaceae bacterium]|nr:MAG: 30S ribosomal protein S20 [Rhodospirillaceae bacterium]